MPQQTVKEALAAAAGNHLDLILTDLNLPDMTGLTMVRYVRQLGNSFARVPVIMLTAFAGSEYRRLAAEAGCNAFFSKPPDFEDLEITIARLLSHDRNSLAALHDGKRLERRDGVNCNSARPRAQHTIYNG